MSPSIFGSDIGAVVRGALAGQGKAMSQGSRHVAAGTSILEVVRQSARNG